MHNFGCISLLEQVHAKDSFQMGIIVRSMDVSREGFDVDLMIRHSSAVYARYCDLGGATILASIGTSY